MHFNAGWIWYFADDVKPRQMADKMSTIIFITKTETKILKIYTGWDFILCRFFMEIDDIGVIPHKMLSNRIIWSNVDRDESKYNIDFYLSVLTSMEITPPEGWRELIEKRELEEEYLWENNKWVKS